MTKVLITVHKRADMGTEEFRRYWRETNGPIVAKVPGLRRYIQDHVLPDPSGVNPPYDGIAELWFDSPEAFQAGLGSPEGQAALADVPNFADPEKLQVLMAEEVTVV